MIATDTFAQYVRRMAATQGNPYIVIAETPHPIRQLDADALQVRAQAMLPAIVAGLTMSPGEIEHRARTAVAKEKTEALARSGKVI